MTFSRLDWLDSSPSTNTALVAAVREDPAAWPTFSAIATMDQTAGRGRLARVWTAPAGRCLALSVFVSTGARAEGASSVEGVLSPTAAGWLSLIAALALVDTVNSLPGLTSEASIKWPNDVQLSLRDEGAVGTPSAPSKLCGILAEAVPGHGVVVGLGINLWLAEDELPVPTAGSLLLAGWSVAEEDRGEATRQFVEDFAGRVTERVATFLASGGDAVSSGIASAVSAATVTVGQRVRIELPTGEFLEGEATGLAESGALVVESAGGVREITVGEITHLRPA